MRRPCRAWPSADAPNDAVACHRRHLRSNRVGGQTQLRGDVIDSQTAAPQERHDPATAAIEKLLPEHWRRDSLPTREVASKTQLTRGLQTAIRVLPPDNVSHFMPARRTSC